MRVNPAKETVLKYLHARRAKPRIRFLEATASSQLIFILMKCVVSSLEGRKDKDDCRQPPRGPRRRRARPKSASDQLLLTSHYNRRKRFASGWRECRPLAVSECRRATLWAHPSCAAGARRESGNTRSCSAHTLFFCVCVCEYMAYYQCCT